MSFATSCSHLCLQRLENEDTPEKNDTKELTLSSSSFPEPQIPFLSRERAVLFSITMILAGAVLGPFLDSYHSAFGVLTYDQPLTLQLWGSPDQPALITSWWVPLLFGLAGLIIGWLYVWLDLRWTPQVFPTSSSLSDPIGTLEETKQPSPPKILLGISLFTLQYWLSGYLFHAGWDRTSLLNLLSLVASIEFVLFDGSLAGLVTSTATAIGGPLIEAALLSLSRIEWGMMHDSGYHYNDLGETGFFPLWILPVYFGGGPAVGNLARGVWNTIVQATPGPKQRDENTNALTQINGEMKRPKPPPGCQVCRDTRCVPCPNCDGVGNYQAMGGTVVTCTSCRGRGFVICRACFSYYGEDPNDIEAIRELLSRMPD